jgi:IS5 family transposase
MLKRRQAIEAIIGHLKAEHRLGWCYLKGEQSEWLNVCGGLEHQVGVRCPQD